MKVIPSWRNIHRTWSMRLGVLGTTLVGVLVAFPEFALHVWSLLPGEFKTFVPEQYMPLAGVVLFVLSLLSRYVRQPPLETKPDD